MVKVGFICEGDTEQILLLSDNFQLYLSSIELHLVNVINACGSGNLLPHNISGYIQSLEKSGAEVIFILTDLDNDICITQTKSGIKAREQDVVIIAVKKIEAWFLANDNAMRSLFKEAEFSFTYPEMEDNPFATINSLLVQYKGRGVGKTSAGKIKLVSKLIDLGFQLPESANHQNCSSVKYFIHKLQQIGSK